VLEWGVTLCFRGLWGDALFTFPDLAPLPVRVSLTIRQNAAFCNYLILSVFLAL